jgi:hypothetical protein
MIRYEILDKNLMLNNPNAENRVEIRIHSTDDKNHFRDFRSNKLKGKFAYTIEKSIFI